MLYYQKQKNGSQIKKGPSFLFQRKEPVSTQKNVAEKKSVQLCRKQNQTEIKYSLSGQHHSPSRKLKKMSARLSAII